MSRLIAKERGLRTMSDAAREFGISVSRFWRLVRQYEVLPKPKTKCGRLVYYSDSEMAAIEEALDAFFGQRRGR